MTGVQTCALPISARVGDGTVILDGNIYRIWYSGQDGTNYRILYADSNDGKVWGNFSQAVDLDNLPAYDAQVVRYPTVLKIGSIYKMWYSGSDTGITTDRIIYCESVDGKTWTNYHLAVDFGNVSGYDNLANNSPTVIKDGGLYKMWYSGQVQDGVFKVSTIYCETQ